MSPTRESDACVRRAAAGRRELAKLSELARGATAVDPATRPRSTRRVHAARRTIRSQPAAWRHRAPGARTTVGRQRRSATR